ncbi:MAG: class I SAM-dependent methyltransferase [bacterium]
MENVYNNDAVMKSYMHGLILSQFLWKNHYLMLKFFIKEALQVEGIRRLLEIGPGHGLYIAQAMKKFPRAEYKIMDISPVSIAMTKKIVRRLVNDPDKISFVQSDVRAYSSDEKFDFIIMGEVMEHVEDPLSLLVSVKKLLEDGGRLHITTCANCPAIDHVYCFDSVEAIVEMIEAAGFRVLKDIALPVEDVPREKWKETRVGINYAAALENSD